MGEMDYTENIWRVDQIHLMTRLKFIVVGFVYYLSMICKCKELLVEWLFFNIQLSSKNAGIIS